LVCGPSQAHLFEEVGRWLTAFLADEDLLSAGTRFLDVGCGCGRVARALLDYPLADYVGFDRHEGMIAWARNAIGSADPRFRFHHAPVRSLYTVWDDQSGSIDADTFTFPCPDASVDTALLASVFTHMTGSEVRRYLSELARVVRHGGGVLLSIFFSDGVEYRRDQVNVFHNREDFLADLAGQPFVTREVPRSFVPGQPFDRGAPLQNGLYTHHWFRLVRSNA
jgi:ubiquinone/menaquinone biosynthesis C-methylase UbiE